MPEKIYKSACPYNCFDCCSFDVYVSGNKVTKIAANQTADFTRNFLCKKGQAHASRMYNPERLRYPLVKTAQGWQRISWPTAYELMANKIKEAHKQYGPTAVGGYVGDGGAGLLKSTLKIFLAHLGGYTDFVGSICWGAGIEATIKDFGAVLGHHPDDIINARTIVLWGRNPLETNLHLVPYLKKAQKKGSKIYLIDPRESASSKVADIHLKIKPGADWALAAACTHYCLRHNKIKHDFIQKHLTDTSGLLPYLKSLNQTDYEDLLEAAGISAAAIAKFTHDLFDHGPSTCYLGYGPQRYKSGGLNIRAINLLWAVTGNIGIKGGGVNYANQANIDLFDFSFALPKTAPMIREMQLGNFAGEVFTATPPLQVLFISGANPAVQLPDSTSVKRALADIPFKICLEHFMTDTAAQCELVLPVTYFTEAEDIITSGMWNSTLKYVNKCVEPLAECKAEFTIFQELAKFLGLSEYPALSTTEWLKNATAKLATYGLDFTTLQQYGYLDSPLQKQVPWDDCQFATLDGKFHAFDKEELQQKLANYMANRTNEQDKLLLLTVHWRDQISSQLPIPLPQQELPLLYIHPATAEKFGVADGARALAIAKNSLEVIIAVTDKASPFAAYMRQGSSKNAGGPVNILTPAGITDIGDQAIFNETSIILQPLTAADTEN
ncbi:MAG: molybdopterin-dependent oxidoreductase [Firmicutes bacterium]|nr:molybdopterin-dependent oxidoreductase [Bacillota bacterium]